MCFCISVTVVVATTVKHSPAILAMELMMSSNTANQERKSKI